AFGQKTTGTISGTARDASGAVIPGADITVTNQATNVSHSSLTNDAGFYSIPNLQIGVYTVSAALTGFKKAQIKDIKIDVAQDKIVDVVLEVGTISDIVQVNSTSPLVELRTGEVSNLVQEKQMTELPLNGRSFVQLTLLVPGASIQNGANTRNTGLLAGVDISVNGNASTANLWLVDGADNVDRGSNRTILVYPSVDSIAEFRVSRNSFGPEAGAGAGANINIVTKSGTNMFHGTAYDFVRNDAFDAVNYFVNSVPRNKDGTRASDKPVLRSNDFGYTIGGPIIRDKAFFFWSEEWRKERRGITRSRLVPTELERKGDFSGLFRSGNQPIPNDPLTGKPFPGNKIPADKLSPAGLQLMRLFPLPNIPLRSNDQAINLTFSPKTPIETRQEQIRGDYQLTEKMSVMARYTQDKWENPAPNYGGEGGLWGDDGLAVVDSNWSQPSKSFVVQLTNNFGTSVVNQFSYSYSNNRIFITHGIGQDIDRDIAKAIPQVFPNIREDEAHATFWGAPGVGGNLWNAAPWTNGENLNVWKDDFSKVLGNHSFKMGYQMTRNWKDEDCCGAFDANPKFWGTNAVNWGDVLSTGNGLADALYKGTLWGATERKNQPRAKTRWRDYESYFGDTWRVRPRFTLNYGVRWSILKQPYDFDNAVGNFVASVFDPKLGKKFDNGMIYPDNLKGITGISNRSLSKEHYRDIGPRVGFAWDPTGSGKNSIRGGAGVYFNRDSIAGGWQDLNTNPPFSQLNFFGDGRPLDSLPATIPAVSLGLPAWSKDLNSPTPSVYQWNMTYERELFKDTKIEFSYVGNKGTHLPQNALLTQVPLTLRLQAQIDRFNGVGADDLAARYSPFGSTFGNNTIHAWARGADSLYNAFQLYLVKRFTNNLTYNVAYTFSKILGTSQLGYLGDTVISDMANIRYDRGMPQFDRTHIFVANAIYNLPKFENLNPVARAIVGGWETTGIYSYNTGIPLKVFSGFDVSGTRNARADIVGDPGGPHTVDKWFNTAAFRIPTTIGALGNSGFGVSGERMPPINNFDWSIYKNFAIPWWKSAYTDERAKIQFRAEFFNTFNHPQFLPSDNTTCICPRNVVTDQSKPDRDVDTATGKVNIPISKYSPTFGTLNRARDPREIQFALKLIW
ncbi:MAG TPA: carboxypeptidase-like regulatory domain-containing protein, partial [Acidobacteriota bacterium]|nr:carboxypeptidase-like regulatory domain-containing protein [Acidobacteriota bacterium]